MLRNYWCANYIILSKVTKILCVNESSLTIVLDTTQSMASAVDKASDAIDSIMDIINDTQYSEIIIVTFNDPDYRMLLKSTSRYEIKAALTSIEADGGGDCPEPSLSGTKLGIRESLNGSRVFVITDADPKDVELESDVKRMCREKQIQVSFVITPTNVQFCRRQQQNGFKLYHEIASACLGEVFLLHNTSDISEVIRMGAVVQIPREVD